MDINKINGDITGAMALTDMVEGRMVCVTSHSFSYDFGSQTDLVAVKLPGTADEAKRARFVVGMADSNLSTPIYQPMPAFNWAMRKGGWDQAANVPFSATVYLTQPRHTKNPTVVSGTACLAYGAGTYTVPSGQFVYNAGLVKGAALTPSYDAGNEGKLKLQATWDADLVVAIVENYDSTTGELTFKTGQF